MLVLFKTELSGLFGAVDSDTGEYESARHHSESVQTTITILSGSRAFTFGIRRIEHVSKTQV